MPRTRRIDLKRVNRAVADLELIEPIFKTCPWQPRELVEEGLREWLRCCGAALRDGKVIGMPSHAVDEAWHGFILCTARYERFCNEAYGRLLHHHPEGAALPSSKPGPSMQEQLERTVIAWSLVAEPGEKCVLWDLDSKVGVEQPWGIPAAQVTEVEQRLAAIS